MQSVMSRENWLKGVRGLTTVKDAVIPSLKRDFSQRARDWNTTNDDLKTLLDLGANKEVKAVKKGEYKWFVNVSGCQPILKKIEMSHLRPARLEWKNNKKDDSCPNEYRLAKIYMPGGNENIEDYKDLDALAVLEILKNDIRLKDRLDQITCLIMFRNRLMHSNNNCISGYELEDAFSTMEKLLQDVMFKDLQECKDAVKELDKLKEKNVICEVDESSETWKLAIDIQNKARGDKGIEEPSPEAMNILLTKVQIGLQEEKVQQLQSELSKSKEQIKYEQRQREDEQRQRESEQERARDYLKMLKSQLEDSKNKLQNLKAKNGELEEKVQELEQHNPTLAGRVARGTATGTGVGLFGGPVGALVGGTAGGVVGGISYLWDRVTR